MKLADIKVKEDENDDTALVREFRKEFPDNRIEVIGMRILSAMGDFEYFDGRMEEHINRMLTQPPGAGPESPDTDSASALLIIDKMTDEIWQWTGWPRPELEISGDDSWCIITTGERQFDNRISIRVVPLSEINGRILNSIKHLRSNFGSINERAASLVAEWTAVPTRKEDTI